MFSSRTLVPTLNFYLSIPVCVNAHPGGVGSSGSSRRWGLATQMADMDCVLNSWYQFCPAVDVVNVKRVNQQIQDLCLSQSFCQPNNKARKSTNSIKQGHKAGAPMTTFRLKK